MKIFFAWHAAVEPEYRKLFTSLVQEGASVCALLPEKWTEGGRCQRAVTGVEGGYSLNAVRPVLRDRVRSFFYLDTWSIAKLIRRYRPDVVHIFEEPYSLVSAQVVWLTRHCCPTAKIVVQSFENIFTRHMFPFGMTQRFVLNQAHGLLTVPIEGKQLWRQCGFRGPIYQANVGLDEVLFARTDDVLRENKERVRIAYIGRLVPEKGISLLIEAVTHLLRDGYDVELWIIGNGSERSTLEVVSRQLNVNGRIVFHNSVESGKLPELYSSIDILVLPSLSTPNWKEQFGRVLIEAMACQVAVLGSSSGEIPYVIGDAGLTFEEGSLPALYDCLCSLVSDEALRKRLGVLGRKRVEALYTWRAVARRLMPIYMELSRHENLAP